MAGAPALFMDVKSAFNNVSKAHLGGRMEALEIEPDLIRWTGSYMSDRQVKLVLDREANPLDTGIPHRSPGAPVLFVTYLSGIFDEVERAASGILRRKKTPPTTAVLVGANAIPFNKEATRWLGVWLESQLTLNEIRRRLTNAFA